MTVVTLLIVFAILYVLQLYFSKNFLLKFTTATYLFFVASAMYFSLETYKGWPTSERPERGLITYVLVDDPTDTSSGAIYIWVRGSEVDSNWFSWFGYTPKNEPRSFVLPYTKESAKEFREAKKNIEEGRFVVLEPTEESVDGGGEDGKAKDNGKSGNRGDTQEEYNVPHLKIVEPDYFLKKEGD